jgi:ubiquitin-conjugating enzyme E2 variant
MTRAQRLFSIASIAAAISLLAIGGVRVSQMPFGWWALAAFILGVAGADLASGLVHWAADTWGRGDLPIIGRRLLKPFRIHHVDPDDFLRRSFIDANGDVAFLAAPTLGLLLVLPPNAEWSPLVAWFMLGLCGVGMWTNQIHQWAHMSNPPRVVRLLQDSGLLLGRREHAAHHAGAYDVHYCITTGWWNGPLESIAFFRRMEALVTRTTGAQPREDERILH